MVREVEGEDIEALRLVFTAEGNHISERQSGTLMDDASKTTRAKSRATNAAQPISARLAFGSEWRWWARRTPEHREGNACNARGVPIHRDAKFRFREVSRHGGRFSLGVELLGGRFKESVSIQPACSGF